MTRTPRLFLFLLTLTVVMIPPGPKVAVVAAQNEGSPINAVAWSPDSTRYATGDYDGYVKIWNAATEQLLLSFPAPDFDLFGSLLITSIDWNPDGNRLAVTASATLQPGGFLWVLDLTTGQTTEFDAESLTYTAAWSPDGTLLAAGVTFGDASSGKHWIKVWDVASQQLVANLEGYSDLIFSVAWSPDGTRLASCSADATAVIWDTTTWTRLLTLGEWPTQATLWGSWSPDGTRLATTSVNGTAGIWDATTGQLLMTLYSDDDEPLYEIVWHPDGTQLAGVSEHAVKIWNAITGQQIDRIESVERLSSIAWSPDGSRLLYAGIGLETPTLLNVPPASCTPTAPSQPPTFTVAAGDVAGLIAAINSANANGNPDIIQLTESTYTLTTSNNTNSGGNGLPRITTNITLYGDCSTITRDAGAPAFRFFNLSSAGHLTLYDLTLSNGDSSTYNGGAIYNQGNLAVLHGTLTSNHAAGGGAIRNSSGTVTITDSEITNNIVANGSAGGIYNSGGSTTITDSIISGNSASSYGGGVYNSSSGTLTLSGSTLSGNSANNGGAAFVNGGTFTLNANSQVINNTASNHGGAIYISSGTLTITGSTLSGNTANDDGGAIRGFGSMEITNSTLSNNASHDVGGAIYHSGGTLTLNGSTLSGNHADTNGGGIFSSSPINATNDTFSTNTAVNGGALFVNGGSVSLTDSALSGNTVTGKGGGIFIQVGTVTITRGTLSNNAAQDDGGSISNGGTLTVTDASVLSNSSGDKGGGIYNDSTQANHINNTCIVGNTAINTGGVFSMTSGLDATNNWWGAANGPSGAEPGSGDAVNANVNFTPFLTGGCPH